MRRPKDLPQELLNQPFTLSQARAAGLSRRRTRAADLASPCHGVRAPASASASLLDRARALATATGAVVSHTSAAQLWGFPLPLALRHSNVIHLTYPPGRHAVRRRGAFGHQMALDPGEVTAGLLVTCTSALRTWFDLARYLSLDDLVMAGDFLLRRTNPLTSAEALEGYLAGKQGRAGYRRARQARLLMRAGTDSPKETELRLLLVRHGLPEPEINLPLFDESGRWIEDPDLAYNREKVAIQYDGGHHAAPAQRRSDISRDENARDAGWRVVVLTQSDLIPFVPGMEPTAVTRVRAALQERGWAAAPEASAARLASRQAWAHQLPPTAAKNGT